MAIGIEYDAVIRREIWVKHYCSSHQTLLVGEGDFSFSLSLAHSFGSASNIVASSLDSFGFYGKEDNKLLIKMHREIVHGFFRNARGMLRANGEIHVNHKTTTPFNLWNLEELASQNSLALIECVDFKAEDYPGYNNKKGNGRKSDDPFPLGACSTYKFGFSPHTKKMQNFVETPIETVRQPIAAVPRPMVPYKFRPPQTNFAPFASNIPGYVMSQPTVGIRSECSRIFPGYFSHVMKTFGRNGCDGDVYNSVHESWFCNVHGRSGRYRTLNLEELHRCSDSRLAWLERTSVSHHQW